MNFVLCGLVDDPVWVAKSINLMIRPLRVSYRFNWQFQFRCDP